MNQSGTAAKEEGTAKYGDAELKNAEVLITMQDKKVVVDDRPMAIYHLEKMTGQNNNIKHLYTQVWKGIDQNKRAVKFKFTVNVESKEAMVEVEYPDFKSYYFGRYNYGVPDESSKQSTTKAF